MRILLGHDGSVGADQARDLLSHLDLPEGTVVTIAGVLPTRSDLPDLVADLEAKLEAAAAGLDSAGWTLERRVLHGRPAEALLAEAARVDADVIVMGSRGHGPFKSAVLGSVSTEVVNASPRPVLVARGPQVERVVLATDGTDPSAQALALVATWRLFKNLDITVVSVSEPLLGMSAVDPAATSAYLLELEADLADEARATHSDMARAAADTLREAGRSANHEVRVGNPAHEIVQAAEAAGADLIVTGSRRGSANLPGALGSVARNVLHNSPTSVLVVREPMTAAADRAAIDDIIEESPP